MHLKTPASMLKDILCSAGSLFFDWFGFFV